MEKSKALSEGLVLAFASAVGYAVAYSYRAGYASHYGLPPLMLSPELSDVMKAAAAVSLTFILLWHASLVIWPMIPPPTTALARSIRKLALMSSLAAALCFVVLDGIAALVFLGSIICVATCLEFVFPLFSCRNLQGYENKLLEQEEIETHYQKATPMQYLSDRIGEGGFYLVFTGVILVFLSSFIGRKDARTQEYYFVVEGKPGYVVAWFERESAILVKYDSKSLLLTPEYVVLPLSGGASLRNVHLGRLAHPRKKP